MAQEIQSKLLFQDIAPKNAGGKGSRVSKHFYTCRSCTFRGWASGDAPTCRDCGVPLERRELVSAELERGEFGLVKWASKRANDGKAIRLTDFIHGCLIQHSLDIVRAEFKAGRAVSPGIAGMLNRMKR